MVTDKAGVQTGVVVAGTLQAGKAKEIGQKVQDLEKQGAKRIILDLRWCVLGPMEEGVAVADLFMESGLITYTEGQRSRKTDTLATADVVTKLPLVVLTESGHGGRGGDRCGGVAGIEARETGRGTDVRGRSGSQADHAGRWQRGDYGDGEVLCSKRKSDSRYARYSERVESSV
ncbi:MAG: S41 family peptidase [Acidobacteriota bacterium]